MFSHLWWCPGEQVLLVREWFCCCWLCSLTCDGVQAGLNRCCWWGNGSAAADYVLSPVMVSRLGWTGAAGERMVLVLLSMFSHLWWCPGWGEQVLLVREWFCCCCWICSLTCDGVQAGVNRCCWWGNGSAAADYVGMVSRLGWTGASGEGMVLLLLTMFSHLW